MGKESDSGSSIPTLEELRKYAQKAKALVKAYEEDKKAIEEKKVIFYKAKTRKRKNFLESDVCIEGQPHTIIGKAPYVIDIFPIEEKEKFILPRKGPGIPEKKAKEATKR